MIPDEPVRGRTPPPWFRALNGIERMRAFARGLLPSPPLARLLGLRTTHVAAGTVTVAMPAAEASLTPNGQLQIVPLMVSALDQPGQSMVGLDGTVRFLRPVRPDGRPMRAVSVLTEPAPNLFVAATEIRDADGEEHKLAVRREVSRHNGTEVDTAGDGFFVRFDSPAQAVEAARAARQATASLGIEIRAGIHTGECELEGNKLAGVAVHVAARIQGAAEPREILASSTVRDLGAGSAIRFADKGELILKGVPDPWRLYAVAD